MIDVRHEPTFDSAAAPRPSLQQHRSRQRLPLIAAIVALAAALAWTWWGRLAAPPGTATPPQQQRAVEDGAPPAQAPGAPAAPLRAPAPPSDAHRLAPPDVQGALEQLLGRPGVLRFLQTANFPTRLVATIDSLGRDHAPVAAWPVQPTPGRFETEDTGAGQRIASANAARYQPFVDFATGVDAAQVAAFYRALYPLLQQAYRELGFGDRDLNERVLQMIDLLLATPQPQDPLQVRLTDVKGPYAPVQPWTRYEFADPGLQSLAAGQKILLRVGPENRARLKAQLRALRAQLVKGAGAAR